MASDSGRGSEGAWERRACKRAALNEQSTKRRGESRNRKRGKRGSC